jgi:hypothetical protein
MRVSRLVPPLLVTLLVTGAAIASAQSSPSGPASAGPLVLSPIPTALVFSPDAKVTTINNATAVLAGGYAGKLIENQVLVGGGAYWLADHRDAARLWYAGLLIGARIAGNDRFNISARSLLGIGEGTVFDEVHIQEMYSHHAFRSGRDVRFGRRDHFLVADPELRLLLALTDALSVTVGGGYRATTAYDGLNEMLRGATASVGLQFNIGK